MSHCLLDNENNVVILTFVPLHTMCPLSLIFKSLSLNLSNFIIFFGTVFFVFLVHRGSSIFVDLQIHSFHQIWKTFGHYLIIFSNSPSFLLRPPITCILVHLKLSSGHQCSIHFFSLLTLLHVGLFFITMYLKSLIFS